MNKIALLTLAVGKDSAYIDAVQRYSPYTRSCLAQYGNLDYYLLTDREDKTEGFIYVHCPTSVWPYPLGCYWINLKQTLILPK